MLRCRAALCLMLACFAAGGASAAAVRLPESNAVPGWEIQDRLRRFAAADLYGHINGGAELILELGFVELLVQPYLMGEQEVSLEVFRMESPLAALAAYLFKCGEETPWPEIGARNSSTRFQATLVRGDCFVLVNSFSGDRDLRPAMTALAGALLKSIPPANVVDPFEPLPVTGRIAGSERLIRGEYSLQSLFTLGPGDVLQLGGNLFGVAADYETAASKIPETRIQVSYSDEKRSKTVFFRLQSVLDPALELLEQSGQRLVFRDHAGRFGQAVRQGPVIEVRVNLAAHPGKAADDPTEP